jgi:hypothetical protein
MMEAEIAKRAGCADSNLCLVLNTDSNYVMFNLIGSSNSFCYYHPKLV